jgi:hypothetical protein
MKKIKIPEKTPKKQVLILIYNESPITYNIDGINIAPLECERY